MKRIVSIILVLALLLGLTVPVAYGETREKQYEKAFELLYDEKYAEAANAFSELRNYRDSRLYAMYCSAIAAGESGLYSIAVTNLSGLNGFLDSSQLATYYTGLSWEATEEYEHAAEVLGDIILYWDVADRIAGYPALINARDYRKAEANERAGNLEAALAGFKALGSYSDSAARAAAVQEKIRERDAIAAEKARADAYEAADGAEQNGDYAAAYAGFSALGNYRDSAERAAAVQQKGIYAQAMRLATEGKFAQAYELFLSLRDYEDSAGKAYVLSVSDFAQDMKYLGQNMAAFQVQGVWGLLDLNSNNLSAPYWDSVSAFNEYGLSRVGLNERYGYVGRDGAEVLPARFADVSAYQGGLVTVAEKSGNNWLFGLYDTEGKKVSAAQWRTLGASKNSDWGSRWNNLRISAPEFSENRIKVQNESGKWGFIASDGSAVGQVIWDDIGSFSEGMAIVRQGDKYGYIGADGLEKIMPQYQDALPFSQGLAAVKVDGLYQFIDKDNRVVIRPIYEQATSFKNDRAYVYLSGTGWQVINPQGGQEYFIANSTREAYIRAEALMEEENYREAYAVYDSLVGFSDSNDKMIMALEGVYGQGIQKRTAGDWDGAVDDFSFAGDYRDAAEQILITRYAEGEAERAAQNWDSAAEAFTKAGNYSDAETQITETRYQEAAALNKAGKYAEAYAIYVTISGYRDVDSIVKTDGNIAATAARKAMFASYKIVGSYVTFGTYPQTKDGTDRTPIEWLVLDYDAASNKSLLISRYGLDVKPYNEKNGHITWEECTLRSWLNRDFYNISFSIKEQQAILMTLVDNSRRQSCGDWSTNGGKNTQDKIFLLSYAEANKYFDVLHNYVINTKPRVAPTAYAIKQGAKAESDYKTVEGIAAVDWWLRSPGEDQYDAAYVSAGGSLSRYGVIWKQACVRPALWLDLNADIF